MVFDDIKTVEKFYKEYAHDTGFSICTGQQRCDDNGDVMWKRFCAQGKDIKQAQQLNLMTLPPRCARLERLDVDVKLILM
jgi:hypothetical protein